MVNPNFNQSIKELSVIHRYWNEFLLHESVSVSLWCSIGFRRIDIVLDHPQKVYYSGHQISGNVHLELDEPTNALGRIIIDISNVKISLNIENACAYLPINIKQSKMYIGQTEPLTVSMSLPVRGYVPGQAIPITILMTNLSTVVVTKIRIIEFCLRTAHFDAAYIAVVSYHSTEKSRKHKEIIVEVEQPVNKDSDTYDVTFDVPAVPPTGMIHCNIIDVLYTLKVEACVDVSEWYYRMFQKNLKLRTNIVVGTVPLQNYETPQKTTDVTEDFSPHPQCTTEEYADDTQPLKNSERNFVRQIFQSCPISLLNEINSLLGLSRQTHLQSDTTTSNGKPNLDVSSSSTVKPLEFLDFVFEIDDNI
ncbi:arrestin domain-containing protein [Apis cerana cerana]|uniref:Arrestin domain-containing protein n=1 Tax=Apis cerana cerana TaxID=94128 RepID=A0A2A3EKT2_APICC|nr:arrestin domain-containing protein [Apis cerana cerana]